MIIESRRQWVLGQAAIPYRMTFSLAVGNQKNGIEVLYRYNNIHGYALKVKSNKQRKALEKTKDVLSVQDWVLQLE